MATGIATSTPAAAGSPWPSFLYSLDFRVPKGNSYSPRALVLDPARGRLYARTHDRGIGASGLVTAVSTWGETAGQVEAVARTGPDIYSEGELALDLARGLLAVVNPSDETASLLDAATLATLRRLPDAWHLALDGEGGWLYLSGRSSLRAVSVETATVQAQVSLADGDRALALAVDPAAGRLYVLVHRAERHWLLLCDAQTLAVIKTVPLPGTADAMLADPARGQVYLSGHDGLHARLWIVDTGGTLVQEVQLGEWFLETPLALHPTEPWLYVGQNAYPNHGLAVVDVEAGQQLAAIELTSAACALALDPEHDRLWFSDTYDDRIGVVDLNTNRVSGSYPTAIGIRDLAVDPGRGHLYVTTTDDKLHAVSEEGGQTLAILPGEGSVAVDAPHGRLYTGSVEAGQVRVFDSDSLQQTGTIPFAGIPVADAHSGGLYVVDRGVYIASLETMTVTGVISDTLAQNPGFSPNPTAVDAVVDPGSGRIFATISNGVPGSNAGTYLYVYEPVTYQKVLTDTERSPWYIDVDPGSGRAYVSRTHLAGRSTSILVDGRRYTARLESLFGPLRVDPSLGRVYLTVADDQRGQMFILDAVTLSVQGAVPIKGRFSLRALDRQRHWLFLATDDGLMEVWSAQGGRLPLPEEPTPADLAAATPERLFPAPGGTPLFALDQSWRLYWSADGQVWGRLGGGLPGASVNDLAFSPGYGQDGTLYAAISSGHQGYGVWLSADGGKSWRCASAGLTDLSAADLEIWPALAPWPTAQGGQATLFAGTFKGGLFRSIDGGQSWVGLAERYRPPDAYPEQPKQILVSPTFGQDRTLFVQHYGLRRSADGGDSWQALDPGVTAYGDHYLFLAPDYADSQTVYDLFIPSDSPAAGQVFGSVDGGQSWAVAGAGPPLEGYARGRLLPAPAGVVYFTWTPYDTSQPLQLYRSSDIRAAGGKPATIRWERRVGQPLEAATPLELTADGQAFLALNKRGRLVSWPVAGLQWEPPAAPTRPPTASPSPQPAPCAVQPQRFLRVWEGERTRLGCPTGQAEPVALAEQRFERGRMIWDSSTSQIYVLLADGTWQAYEDTWIEGVDPAWDTSLPPPPQQPQRGFGKVWREQLGGAQAAIGWAQENERGVDGWREVFEGGLLLWTDAPGTAYLLYADGTWQAVAAPS